MGYSGTTEVIIYWKPDQTFVIHRAHHIWSDGYNYCLSTEDKHTTGYLVLQQDPEIHIHNSDPLNLIPCELDLTSTLFSDKTILAYEIELPPSRNKFGPTLLDEEYFTIPYIIDIITNLRASRQLPTQAKQNMWVVAINGEDSLTTQGAIDELNKHQTPRRKSKVNISL